jgi:hypothetical protein
MASWGPLTNGTIQVSVRDVPAGSRAGAEFFGRTDQVYPLTDAIRAGQQDIPLNVNGVPVGPPSPTPNPPEDSPKQDVVLHDAATEVGPPILNAAEPEQTVPAPLTLVAAPIATTLPPFVPNHPGPDPGPDPATMKMAADIIRRIEEVIFRWGTSLRFVPPDPMDPPDLPFDSLPLGDAWDAGMVPAPRPPDAPATGDALAETAEEWPTDLDPVAVAEVFATTPIDENKRSDFDNARP